MEHIASIFKVKKVEQNPEWRAYLIDPENGGEILLRNASRFSTRYVVLYLRMLQSTCKILGLFIKNCRMKMLYTVSV
jgi:hypothetical protein